MEAEERRIWTASRIAEALAVPSHRVNYIIRSRDIRPLERAGNARVFGPEAVSQSRYESTPAETVIELKAEGYEIVGTRSEVREEDDIDTIAGMLPSDGPGLTVEEVKDQWPKTLKPGNTRLRGLLNQGFNEHRWHRFGCAVRNDPWRYRAHPPQPDSFQSPPSHSERNESGANGLMGSEQGQGEA